MYRASWSTQQDSGTRSIQLGRGTLGAMAALSYTHAQYRARLYFPLPSAPVTETLLQDFEDISTTASPQQRPGAGIISTVTPSQWENLLGDALY